MMTATVKPSGRNSGKLGSSSLQKRVLGGACLAHALHDGFSDLIYVLLPVWQGQFGLGFSALALLRALYVGTLAALQVPSTLVARQFSSRGLLVVGTLLSAGGYGLAGLSGGLMGLCISLALAGAGGSTQHPLASAAVSKAYGQRARGPLGTYNFAGDIGKATLPPAATLLLKLTDWHATLWILAGVGIGTAFLIRWLLPAGTGSSASQAPRSSAGTGSGKGGFGLLFSIGVLDSAVRMAFLLFLPFLLQAKGATLTTVGLALSLVFVGGAFGKAICAWLGTRLGITWTVIMTESGTAAAILAVLALPLGPAVMVLPLLGVMLNGTSSVLYGTVPELVPGSRAERAFALFYTGTLGSSALAPILYGQLGDLTGPNWAATAAAATAIIIVPLMLLLAPRLQYTNGERLAT
jgi:FSR family fosmidomycin resistance protein-like MFS transporter